MEKLTVRRASDITDELVELLRAGALIEHPFPVIEAERVRKYQEIQADLESPAVLNLFV